MQLVYGVDGSGSLYQDTGSGGSFYPAVPFYYAGRPFSGGKLGAVSVGLYAVLGLAGLPVFAEGGGFWYILKPSFGYIIGFILGSYVTGKMTEKSQGLTFGRILAANFTGLAIVYGVGMIYYYVICNFVINTPIGVWPLFLYCFLLAVPGDICLCFVAAVLAKRIKPVIGRM